MILPIIVMGVSGAGKTTLAQALAHALDRPFIEGDTLHPAANIAKMTSGRPLTDEDRWPFLDNVALALATSPAPAVASCSALKRSYRDRLRAGAGDLLFVFPDVSRADLERRMAHRADHFMPPALLDSQLATLEPPTGDERVVHINGALGGDEQLPAVLAAIKAQP